MVTYRQYSTDHGDYHLSLLLLRLGGGVISKPLGAYFHVIPPTRSSFTCYFRFRRWWQAHDRQTFELTSINWCSAIPKKSTMMPNPQPVGWLKSVVRDQGMLLLQANYPTMDYVPGTAFQLPKLVERKPANA